MKLGMVGLGRMGGNMAQRLRNDGHEVVGFDRDPAVSDVATLEDLVAKLDAPRVVWVMVPSGKPTDDVIETLGALLAPGDVVIDGGNTYFRDTEGHAAHLAAADVHFVDVGTSGGIWGLEVGYCLMVGGEPAVVDRLAPIFTALAPANGWLRTGGHGAGHYVKMIHNGIEYGLMQAYAEGFELMSASSYDLDLPAIAKLWNQGSVVRSWLLELAASALAEDPRLKGLKPYVEDSGEGRWTVEDAVEKSVPAPVITASLYARFRSRRDNSFADRLLAALRNAFGGHAIRR